MTCSEFFFFSLCRCIARKHIDAKGEGGAGREGLAVADAEKANVELTTARGIYEDALTRKGDFADAVLALGQLEFERGKMEGDHKYFEHSIEYFKKAMDLSDENADLKAQVRSSKQHSVLCTADSPVHSLFSHQAQVMWGNGLYEMSQLTDDGWRETLGVAVEKFKIAKCAEDEVKNALTMHSKAADINVGELMKGFSD